MKTTLPALIRFLLPFTLKENIGILSYRSFDRLLETFEQVGFSHCQLFTDSDWNSFQAEQILAKMDIFFVGIGYEHQVLETFLEHKSLQKLVLILPSSVLFSQKKSDIALRHRLLDANVVAKVLQLPNTLFPNRTITFSTLVLDKRRGEQNTMVPFLDAREVDVNILHEMVEEQRFDQIEAYLKPFLREDIHNSYSVEELNAPQGDANLLASMRCLNEEQRAAYQVLREKTTEKLSKVATIIRPPMPLKDGSGERVQCLPLSGFHPFGYTDLGKEGGEVMVLPVEGKESKYLQDDDIVLCCKGSIGLVGFVRKTEEAGLWSANHSCCILRAKKDKIDPRFLYLYLRSELGQQIITSKSNGPQGKALQNVHLKDIDVIIPTEAEKRDLEIVFQEELRINQEIEVLRKRRAEIAHRFWHLSREEA